VIAISAYTEPIPVDANINETPHVHDNEDSQSSSDFAQILAGLLQSSQLANQSGEDGHNSLAANDALDGDMLNISAISLGSGIDFDSFDIDLSDAAIDKEYQNIISADQLIAGLMQENHGEDFNILLNELDEGTLNRLAQLMSSSKNDLSLKEISAKIEKSDADSISSMLSALDSKAKLNKDDINLDPSDKNKRIVKDKSSISDASLKEEKIDSLYRNKANDENFSSLSSREENKSRLDEFRRSRKDRLSIEVRDLRTVSNIQSTLAETQTNRVSPQSVQEITLNLRIPEYDKSIMQAQTTWDTKANTSASSALENMLARELHNFNGDIVRHASMALRDGGAGTIKIALHPETLGNVKIHLELTDNKITGRIVVDSQEALNAFRKEIAALEQAFKESGFTDASLNLSLSAEEGGADKQELDESAFNQRLAASNYEDSYEMEAVPVIDVLFGQRSGLVNLLA